MMNALWFAAGVSCEVISGGEIQVGDTITIEPNDERVVLDPGNQSRGFFIKPTERSAAMVTEALESKKRAHKYLVEIDKEGVDRLQASYQSAGLSFWPKTGN